MTTHLTRTGRDAGGLDHPGIRVYLTLVSVAGLGLDSRSHGSRGVDTLNAGMSGGSGGPAEP